MYTKTNLKRIISLFLTLAMTLGMLPIRAYAFDGKISNNLAAGTGVNTASTDVNTVGTDVNSDEAKQNDFEFDASTNTITKYNGNDHVLNIPDTINGVPVKNIGEKAFLEIKL